MDDEDRADPAVLEQVHREPVGERRHQHLAQRPERVLHVERAGQGIAGPGQEPQSIALTLLATDRAFEPNQQLDHDERDDDERDQRPHVLLGALPGPGGRRDHETIQEHGRGEHRDAGGDQTADERRRDDREHVGHARHQ